MRRSRLILVFASSLLKYYLKTDHFDAVEALPESQTQHTRSGKGRPARNRRGDSAAPSDANGSVAPGSPGPVIMYAGSGKKKRAYIVEKVAPPQNGLTEEEINEDLLYLQKVMLLALSQRSTRTEVAHVAWRIWSSKQKIKTLSAPIVYNTKHIILD